jgi:hypothetical protein
MIIALQCPICWRLVTQQVTDRWESRWLICRHCLAAPQRVREARTLIYLEAAETK